jgi:molecular chaperone GrpE
MSIFDRAMKKKDNRPDEALPDARDASPELEDPADLSAALADMTRERDEFQGRWQRAQADFQNLRRRTQTDIDGAVRRSQQSLLEGLLLGLDQLQLALSAPRTNPEAVLLARGVEMTRDELLRTLTQAGVQPMAEVQPGVRFDPARHQAVASLPSESAEPGSVIEVVRGGYSWGDLVLRPAQVVVAAAPALSEDAKGEPAS